MICAAVALFAFVLRADAREAEEYEVKAAMLVNIARFVEWPEWKLGDAHQSFVIGLIGPSDAATRIESLMRDKRIGDKPIVVRHVRSAAASTGCHLVFVLGTDRPLAYDAGTLSRTAVLTVGETDRFAVRGGVVALVRRDKRIQIEVNVKAAQRAGLNVSSRILHLANLVEDGT